jgi:hypothetical protein
MAEDKARRRPEQKPESEIAAADLLFRDLPAAKPAKPAGRPSAGGADDVFEVLDAPEPADPAPSAAAPAGGSAPLRGEVKRPKEPRAERSKVDREPDPADLVQEVWTRRAEWGPNLIIVAVWVSFILLFVFYGPSLGLALTFLTLVFGAVVAAVLAYPMLITLERPVRVTPEQALRDYYGALSHHLPHFRRMWLLLSTSGRTSSAYGSLEGFKRYWRERLTGLRAGHAGAMTPLVFEIADFNSDKSAGKTRIDADFTLKVYVRGRRKSGTIHSVPMHTTLARGPDKMWYLENGTLSRSEKSKEK